jgi:hypothetical protein
MRAASPPSQTRSSCPSTCPTTRPGSPAVSTCPRTGWMRAAVLPLRYSFSIIVEMSEYLSDYSAWESSSLNLSADRMDEKVVLPLSMLFTYCGTIYTPVPTTRPGSPAVSTCPRTGWTRAAVLPLRYAFQLLWQYLNTCPTTRPGSSAVSTCPRTGWTRR